jgi:hypothetical protein
MTPRWVILMGVLVACGGTVAAVPTTKPGTSPLAVVTPDGGVDAMGEVVEAGEPREVGARHILVRVGDFPNGQARTLKQAADVIAEVQRRFAQGEDFARLAREYSEDPGTAKRGGDVGSFPRVTMVKEFEDAVFALAPHETTVVVTVFGIHFVQRTR